MAFTSDGGMSWRRADGGGGLEQLTKGAEFTHGRQNPRSWSPDGKVLAFHGSPRTTGRDIWVLRLDDRKAQPFVRTSFKKAGPRSFRTGAGSHMSQTSRAFRNSMSSPTRLRGGNGRFRRTVARSQHGIETGESCSTAAESR